MRYPNFREENKLRRKGFRSIVGIDEVGRGPLASSVVAAAVVVGKEVSFPKLKNSKDLSFSQREEIFKKAKKDPRIEWGIGRVSEKVIDRINILEATRLAMKRAVVNLRKDADFLIIDGNIEIDINISQKSIIKGDEKVFSCALASVIAKVVRDRAMLRYHKKYPFYRFDKHKGYGTKLHKRMIKEYGLCKIHRKSFKNS